MPRRFNWPSLVGNDQHLIYLKLSTSILSNLIKPDILGFV